MNNKAPICDQNHKKSHVEPMEPACRATDRGYSNSVIEIDGSQFEGGGQILRNAISLSAITSTPIFINNIRKSRDKPGLRPQHLAGVKLCQQISSADLDGGVIGSESLKFTPHLINGGNFSANPGTAGSIALLLQISLPIVFFANNDSVLRLHGGTNCEMAPQIDFLTEVFRPNLERFGPTFDFTLHRRGYFPKGGGEVLINTSPVSHLKAIKLLEQGEVVKIFGWAFVAGTVPIRVAHEMAQGAVEVLQTNFRNVNVEIERYKEAPDMASGNASGIILVCETNTGCVLGGSALGNRKVSAFQSGQSAGLELLEDLKSGACVDRYVQDMLIMFMALAQGKSKMRVGEVTLHTKSAIYVAEKILGVKFEVVPCGSGNTIEVEGIGIENKRIR